MLNINKRLATLSLFIISSMLIVSCSNNIKSNRFNRGTDPKHMDSLNFYGEQITPEREQELLEENVVYFGYDRDDITYKYELILLAHAKKLLENPNLNIRIDGHTDERGSAEYNIGLGERRAKAVKRFMEVKGVPSQRIVSVSYGKEKPAVIGHKEEAWRLNRRAELHYE